MRLLISGLVLSVLATSPALAGPPTPEEHFGHRIGADRRLVPYPQILAYLDLLDEASDRVSIEDAGASTLGNPIRLVVLTSPANQARLPRLREVARRLADPRGLSPGESAALADEGAVIALVTCSIHSTEVGSTQMAAELVYDFATTEDPVKLAWMEDVVLLLMPSINPDGQLMVADWYERWLGTEHEGGRMPWLYHHYVGHDNNRDFFMLTQKETQVVNDVLYHRWFPQVFLDQHQMGTLGPRMFVPPQTDPLDPEVHPLVFRQADAIGTTMSLRLEEAGKTGVGHDMIFDSYWPGGTRNTAWWKNVTGLLTEVASARIASPVLIDPGELRGDSKGLPEYQRRSNFPSPWPGGWWRLRDIVEYELVATWALVEACSENRAAVLRNLDRMARGAIARGGSEAPFAFIMPPTQHDPVAAARLVELLLRHGVEISRAAAPLALGYAVYPAGTVVIPAAQPYRSFLLTMLRPQRYPEVRAMVDGPILPPYDVTSWSLPIAMGVELVEAAAPVAAGLEPLSSPPWPQAATDPRAAGHLIPAGADSAYRVVNELLGRGRRVARLAADGADGRRGDIYLAAADVPSAELAELAAAHHAPVAPVAESPSGPLLEIAPARVGLYKPWAASMDEGWTRFILEQYGFPLVSLDNESIRSGAFAGKVDVLVLPAIEPAVIATGEPESERERSYWSPLPPEYAGGLDEWPNRAAEAGAAGGKRGAATAKPPGGGERIKQWIEAGGTVVALDASADYLIELLKLPVQNALKAGSDHDLRCPGASLRVAMDLESPLTFGLRAEEAIFFADSPAFTTRLDHGSTTRRVIARYPDDLRDILLSGHLEGGDLLERKAAVVELGVGRGRVVLIGFRAQHRAQTVRTFKLLFNALYRVAPQPPVD
ncbi:MAG: M14 family metallopeptidase [Thermoanaerobaculales bacterium]|nr:M14 family metallopeptidase [Thermoanaerobaculales bacterium]